MAFSAVTITVFHDFKNFDFCIDVFDIYSNIETLSKLVAVSDFITA